MAVISGHRGSIVFGTGYTANSKSWTLDYNAEALETTIYNLLANRSYLGGLKSWSGSYECFLDTDTVMVAPGAAAAAVTFYARPGVKYRGSIIITNCSMGTPVDGIVTANMTYQGTGALSIVTVTTTTAAP